MIRQARQEDLEAILAIYEAARRTMRESGNPTQWGGAYPPAEMLREDIEKGQLYLLEAEGTPHGVFALIPGEDPTYRTIEGAWRSNLPYGTIHRIASDGQVKGVFAACLAYCKARCTNIRIDTHEDNRIMQHVIEKYGFVRCGVIHLEDGSPRIAYQYVGEV